MSKAWTVAIVGRTNVGKSTLFNRLSSSVKSLTFDREGVTRDVLKDQVSWGGKEFTLIDTGGISLKKSLDVVTEKVRQQALKMVHDADIVLLVVDGSVGILPEDRAISHMLHKEKKKTIVVVNKIDRVAAREQLHEAYGLGHESVVAVSAAHGTEVGELLSVVVAALPGETVRAKTEAAYRVMFLGRPNAGKSSLMNALLQYERTIVSDIPGTTREPITEKVTFFQEHIALIDTPGVRRKRAVSEELETLMVKRSLQTVHDADIVVLVVDPTEGGLVDQDLKLAFYAFTEQYKPLVVVINKTDILTPEMTTILEERLAEYEHLLAKVPVVRISCKTGKNVGRVLPTIHEVWQRVQQTFSAGELTMLFKSQLAERPLIRAQRKLTIQRAFQGSQPPITIVLEVDEPQFFESSQRAFFENSMRAQYDLRGIPIRFIVRK